MACALILLLCPLIVAIPIPNAQIGDAEVDCQQHQIDIVFATENEFEGRVFVVGHVDNEKCVSVPRQGKTASISIPLDECGMSVTRSVDPPGLIISTKVMLSFHSTFVTKVDRTKEAVEVAAVGQQVLHTWKCSSSSSGEFHSQRGEDPPPSDLWCMRVHNCVVEDEHGVQITVLNDDGCAVDRYLLDNLEYGPGDLEAQKEAHAFKASPPPSPPLQSPLQFADHVAVNFQCSIRLDIRDGDCPVPECEDLGKRSRVARSLNTTRMSPHGVEMDVRAQSMEVVEARRAFSLGQDQCEGSISAIWILIPLFLFPIAAIIFYCGRHSL